MQRSTYGEFSTATRLLNVLKSYYLILLTYIFLDGIENVRKYYGGDLATAIYEFIAGFPLSEVTIGFDRSVGKVFKLQATCIVVCITEF